MTVSGFTAALDLDTYPLSNLICPQCAEQAKPGRGKPVLIICTCTCTCIHVYNLARYIKSPVSVPFRPFSPFSCARVLILHIERSIEREASAEFSSRLKQERTVRSYQKTT